jgi:AcrR family transcriptional regulator
MHFVSQSAIQVVEGGQPRTDKRLLTAHRITRCAQKLTAERGLDGFTMEELAERADVSRRTLFNYFAGKDDAVLGGPPVLDSVVLETFASGGPHGSLVPDLAEVVGAILAQSPETREDVARGRQVMLDNPRLIALAHQRLEGCIESCMPYIEAREGAAFDRTRIDVGIALVLACFHLAMQRYLDADSPDLATLFTESLGTARDLLT